MAVTQVHLLLDQRDRVLALAAVNAAPFGMAVTIDYPKRSREQNKRLWDMLHAIAKSDKTFYGERWSAEDWKEILGSAWLRSRGRDSGKLVRGLEGEPVVIGGFRSSRLSTKDFAEFSDAVLAFIDTNGITWVERTKPPEQEES